MSHRLERNPAFGDLVRRYAERHHLSQKEIAGELKVGDRQFRRFKKGLVPLASGEDRVDVTR